MDNPNLITPQVSLQTSRKYLAWKKNIEHAGCQLESMEPMQICSKPNGSLLFAFLKTRVLDPEGRPLPAYALLRGHACVIVTVMENLETGGKKFLMVRQRRIGHGAESLEFPAGMLDENTEDAKGVAIRELEEETGLKINSDSIVPLSDQALYSSPGLDDEAIHYFLCQIKLSPEEMSKYESGEKGLADEHEYIQIGLWNYADAWNAATSLQVRFGFLLYQDYLRSTNSNSVQTQSK